jgi:DNA-binding CsgD family transcriptional regulator
MRALIGRGAMSQETRRPGLMARVHSIAPRVDAPRELVAWRVDEDGECFALLVWPTSAPSVRGMAKLTAAEAAVAALAIAGRSNAQIARERGTTDRTIANQLASAFRKLRVRSRAELCARVGCGDRGWDR